MKFIFFSLVFIFFHLTSHAQEGVVTVEQDPNITRLLDIYKKMNTDTGFYTIQIGFGSYAVASRLKAEAGVDFPQYYANIIFDSPTYRVHLGRFKNRMDVERIYTEVRKKYPESLILNPVK